MEKTEWRKLWRRLWPVLVLLIYIALNFFLVSRHENWRDEAQAWQIARLTDWKGLFAQLKYEGHPVLWYLVLMPFAKGGFPFEWMGLISLALMSVAAWLLIRKAPFAVPVKLLLLFSPFFVYYYPVVSRSYSLVPPILAALAVVYPKRKEKPILYGVLIALLSQTHIYMVAVSFMLSFAWLCETAADAFKGRRENAAVIKRNICGLGISLASALFLIWELIGSTGANTGIDISPAATVSSNLHRISVGAEWAVNFALGIWMSDEFWAFLKIVLIVCALVLIVFSFEEGLIFTIAAFLQVLMFTYVYLPSEQKAILVVHELIFTVWVVLEKRRREELARPLPALRALPGDREGVRDIYVFLQRTAWQAALVIMAAVAYYGHNSFIREDVDQAYSASKDIAEYIDENVPEDAVIAAAGYYTAYPIAAYLPEREIYYPPLEDILTYAVWNDERNTYITVDEMLERIGERYPDCTGFYLISCGSDNVSDVSGLEGATLLLEVDAMLSEESASLYYVEL